MCGVSEPPCTTLIDDVPESAALRRQLHLCVVYPTAAAHVSPQPLTPETVLVVGRDVGDRGLRIDDPKLSRLHFRLSWEKELGAPRLTDAGSRNGTFVNGERVTTCIVSAGDVVRAGGTLFVIDDAERHDALLSHLDRAARSPLTVLLVGETGTGKEVMARRVHAQSGRGGPFVPVNCAAIPRDLMASEFFGHTKGAFSGAGAARPGLFLAARGGTLFLDEIGELPSELQPTLLRALQERRIRPVGTEREIEVDVRLIAATNCPVEQLARGATFRADLYARLAQVVIELPPLRARRSELLRLATELAREAGGELETTPNATEALLLWPWPHNVRELRSLVDAAMILRPGGGPLSLTALHELRPEIGVGLRQRTRRQSATTPSGGTEPPQRAAPDRASLERLLARHGGNISAIADELGAHRTQVYRWLDRHGIERRR